MFNSLLTTLIDKVWPYGRPFIVPHVTIISPLGLSPERLSLRLNILAGEIAKFIRIRPRTIVTTAIHDFEMREGGLEPPIREEPDPKSGAYANSATLANVFMPRAFYQLPVARQTANAKGFVGRHSPSGLGKIILGASLKWWRSFGWPGQHCVPVA